MEYLYKPDWERTKKMFEAYWHQENEERCLLNIRYTNEPELLLHLSHEGEQSLEDFWLDTEVIMNRYLHYFENTYFAAESLPIANVFLGPGVTASYLGSPYILAQRTIWFESIIKDWEKDKIVFDENSFMWKKTLELTKAAVELGKGKFFVDQTDLSGVMDILSHLRGAQPLLYDLIESPDAVKKARDEVLDIWFKCIYELYDIIKPCNDGGSLSWIALWSDDIGHALQSDFSAMISPKMFEEFVLPEIQEQCKKIPYSIFHLDGPGMLPHLDLLLEVKELKAIQWQPGAGQPKPVEWPDVLKKIQAKGKCLHEWGSCQEALDMLDYLSPKGLYFDVRGTLDSKEETDAFIKEVERKCRNK